MHRRADFPARILTDTAEHAVAIPCELGRLFRGECFLFAFHADTIAASIVRVNYMIRRKLAGRSVLQLAINQRAQQCVCRLVLAMQLGGDVVDCIPVGAGQLPYCAKMQIAKSYAQRSQDPN
jgi:hypothetical protein